MTNTLTFDHPGHELIRFCLRLEHSFKQLDFGLSQTGEQAALATLFNIIEIVNLLDRSNLRSKLTTLLTHYYDYFARLRGQPKIANDKLTELLDHLETSLLSVRSTKGRYAQELRDQEFLNHVRKQLACPGGSCSADSPAIYYWLHLPETTRQQHYKAWLNELTEVKELNQRLLTIIRNSASSQTITAENGFYQQSMNPKQTCELIQVSVSPSLQVYPEISAGKHRLMIRFIEPALKEKAKQTAKTITFQLSCSTLVLPG